jgi:hypothetical protein
LSPGSTPFIGSRGLGMAIAGKQKLLTRYLCFEFRVGTGVVWVLVVWPSIRLGFRIKRAIFCGGLDLRHPFFNKMEKLKWEGYVTAKVNDDPDKLWVNPFRKWADRKQQQTTLQAFPKEDVYKAEDALYQALGRRKPSEVPVDMLLAISPYLLTALAVLDVIGLVQVVAGGLDLSVEHWFMLLLMVLFPVLVFQVVVLQTVRNYRARSH